jgi:hypothetical protein
MKQVFKIDSNGFYVEPVILQDNDKTRSDCVETMPPSLFKAKFLDGAWVEGATAKEITDIKKCSSTCIRARGNKEEPRTYASGFR